MKKLLVVVDYQRDFVDGSLGFEDAKHIEKPICDKIGQYLKNGDDVIFTLDTHSQKYLFTEEGKNLPVKHCIKGTAGWSIYGNVQRLSEDRIKIEKPAFGGLGLADYLKDKDYPVIELCGVVTNICVMSNAVIAKAACPLSHIVIDASCVASNDRQLEEESFKVMEGMHIEVVNHDQSKNRFVL